MTDEARDFLVRQFDIAWKLTSLHLDGLSTEECLWRPATIGPHVRREIDGHWYAEWPEHERYELGPPSIAWITWHIGFWWSMAIDHSFGDAKLARENVVWPGTADGVRDWIFGLHGRWKGKLGRITDQELRYVERTRWPFRDRPFGDVVAWVNLELAKNSAELGYARLLYAARAT